MEILAPRVGLGGKSSQKNLSEFGYSYYKIDIQWWEQTAQGYLTRFSLNYQQIYIDDNGIIRGLITKEYFGEIMA